MSPVPAPTPQAELARLLLGSVMYFCKQSVLKGRSSHVSLPISAPGMRRGAVLGNRYALLQHQKCSVAHCPKHTITGCACSASHPIPGQNL